jgi:hypothetical protein
MVSGGAQLDEAVNYPSFIHYFGPQHDHLYQSHRLYGRRKHFPRRLDGIRLIMNRRLDGNGGRLGAALHLQPNRRMQHDPGLVSRRRMIDPPGQIFRRAIARAAGLDRRGAIPVGIEKPVLRPRLAVGGADRPAQKLDFFQIQRGNEESGSRGVGHARPMSKPYASADRAGARIDLTAYFAEEFN